jgi:hypothetical protein
VEVTLVVIFCDPESNATKVKFKISLSFNSPTLKTHLFEGEVERAAGKQGELLAHDVDGAGRCDFCPCSDEGGDEREAHILHEVAATGFSDRAELGVKNQGGLVDAFVGEGIADTRRRLRSSGPSGCQDSREDTVLGSGSLSCIPGGTLEAGDGLLVSRLGIGDRAQELWRRLHGCAGTPQQAHQSSRGTPRVDSKLPDFAGNFWWHSRVRCGRLPALPLRKKISAIVRSFLDAKKAGLLRKRAASWRNS